ncbi:MAG TPA: Rieske 2Fe-2S domain-containing protein [Nitrospiria bacterium]
MPDPSGSEGKEFIPAIRKREIEPGRSRVVFIRGFEIALFNIDGVFFAVDNLCPHEGGPLVAGSVRGPVVTCPWHQWQFDLATGLSPVNPAVKLKTYPVQIDGDFVKIAVS